MKLGKSLIITGLLFSSVLGSVNVGSITAMAADAITNVSDNNKKKISVEYTINNKKKAGEGLPSTVEIDKNSEYVKKSDIKIDLTKYEFVSNENQFKIDNNLVRVELRESGVPGQGGQAGQGGQPSQPGQQGTTGHSATEPHKHGGYAVQRVRITFIDKNTNELVGNLQLNGLATHTKKIEAPKNYELVNANDADIKFDTKGNKDIKISVRKTKSSITKSEGIVTTNNGEYKRLYTIDGKMVGNRALAAGTKWYTDQQITVGGDLMYRVATNEWVKAFDVK